MEYIDIIKKVRTETEDKISTKEILQELDKFSKAISTASDGKVELKMERGFFSNLGQEWAMRLYRKGTPDPLMTLFRAHVPAKGTTYLDLGDKDMVACEEAKDVHKHLSEFLEKTDMVQTIDYLKEQE